MKRGHCLGTGFLVLILIIAFPAVRGNTVDTGDTAGPFQIKRELAPHLPDVKSYNARFAELWDLGIVRDADISYRFDSGKNKDSIITNGIDLHYFKLSFSRAVLSNQLGQDALRRVDGSSDTLSKMLSLPSLLRNPSSRETLGTLGEIFQPRLNLEIEF